MPSAHAPLRRQRLPAYALYGEALETAPLLAHCEPIADRSRLHGWEIRPHQHTSLYQLVVIRSGRAQVLLDGRRHQLQGPALITVPALCAHGYVFAPSIQGDVFTLSERHLSALLDGHPGLSDHVLRPQGHKLLANDARAVLAAAAMLRAEAQRADNAWHRAGLDAALLHLAVAVARARPRLVLPRGAAAGTGTTARTFADTNAGNGGAPGPRALHHVQRLRALVELQYRQQPSQMALAAALNISPAQLNRACQQLLGHPAQAVLHARLLLQAERELAYTEVPIKQIAHELGFSDAAYFTRFFRRHAGLAPSAWRAAQRTGSAP